MSELKKIRVVRINGRLEPRHYEYQGKALKEFSYFAKVSHEGKEFECLLKHSSEKIDEEIKEGSEYNSEKKEYQGQSYLKISRLDAVAGGQFQRKAWTPPPKHNFTTLEAFAGKSLELAKAMAGKHAENPEILHKFFDTILRTFSVSCDMEFGTNNAALDKKVSAAIDKLTAAGIPSEPISPPQGEEDIPF